MGNTLIHLLYHFVFSTKGRLPLIDSEIQQPLYAYMGGIIKNQGGMPDHVHCLVRLPARKAVSDIMRVLKSDSSRWVNQRRPQDRFAWQTGYGGFTVSESQVEKVRRYIQTQEEHHRKASFKEEVVSLLEKHNVEYNEQYLWD